MDRRKALVLTVALSLQERYRLLAEVDAAARKEQEALHYFRMMKELTLWGYFTSETGATQALRYNPVPGRDEECVPYHNEHAWS